jgi:hypothetical protein
MEEYNTRGIGKKKLRVIGGRGIKGGSKQKRKECGLPQKITLGTSKCVFGCYTMLSDLDFCKKTKMLSLCLALLLVGKTSDTMGHMRE